MKRTIVIRHELSKRLEEVPEVLRDCVEYVVQHGDIDVNSLLIFEATVRIVYYGVGGAELRTQRDSASLLADLARIRPPAQSGNPVPWGPSAPQLVHSLVMRYARRVRDEVRYSIEALARAAMSENVVLVQRLVAGELSEDAAGLFSLDTSSPADVAQRLRILLNECAWASMVPEQNTSVHDALTLALTELSADPAVLDTHGLRHRRDAIAELLADIDR